MLGAGDPSMAVLARDEASDGIERVAVAVAGRVPEDADRAGGLVPAQDAVVGDVADEQVATGGDVDRTFRPTAAEVDPLDPTVAASRGSARRGPRARWGSSRSSTALLGWLGEDGAPRRLGRSPSGPTSAECAMRRNVRHIATVMMAEPMKANQSGAVTPQRSASAPPMSVPTAMAPTDPRRYTLLTRPSSRLGTARCRTVRDVLPQTAACTPKTNITTAATIGDRSTGQRQVRARLDDEAHAHERRQAEAARQRAIARPRRPPRRPRWPRGAGRTRGRRPRAVPSRTARTRPWPRRR